MSKIITSAICPVRDEQENVTRLFSVFKPVGGSTELLLIEGGSHDATWAKAKALNGKKNKHGVVFKVFKQRGKGKAEAVVTGFDLAQGMYLMIVDADMTVPQSQLTKIFRLFKQYGDEILASGNRLKGWPKPDSFYWINYLGNYFFRYYYSLIQGTTILDISCGTKAMTKVAWTKVKKLRARGGAFDSWGDIDWLYYGQKAGLKIRYVDVTYVERVLDESKLQNMGTRWKFAWNMFAIGLEILNRRLSQNG
jgi:glycosyltransferase involved in cell wall biosynthesis